MKILIKSISLLLALTLMGCSSLYISQAQMSTVASTEDSPLLGASTADMAEGSPTYSMTGSGGL